MIYSYFGITIRSRPKLAQNKNPVSTLIYFYYLHADFHYYNHEPELYNDYFCSATRSTYRLMDFGES